MLQEEEEERSKKEDDPRVNFRFAQIANEQDIQHMVSRHCRSVGVNRFVGFVKKLACKKSSKRRAGRLLDCSSLQILNDFKLC